MRIECGSVSATTRPPCAAAWSDAASCDSCPVGFIDDTPRTFQLSGRCAATDIAASRSRSSSVKPLMQPARIASSVVPGAPRTAPARATSSSWDAARDGTGSPSASLCVGAVDVLNPIAPAAHASRTSAAIASICSSDAGSWHASPITTRRTAEWPTWKPAFTPICPSSRSNQSV
jgi:hypothetical protein